MTQNWTWQEGTVDTERDHLAILYGALQGSATELVAWVSKPHKQMFTVEFRLPEDTPDYEKIMTAVKRELDFYLVEKQETDPWEYMLYHCTTSSNIYSDVHWSYHQKE